MAFQPVQTSANVAIDLDPSGLIYKAKVNEVSGFYLIGHKIEVQTKNIGGVVTIQYLNLNTGSIIPNAIFNEADFDVLGSTAVTAPTPLLKLGTLQGRTVFDANVPAELPFTLQDWVTSLGSSVPIGTNYVSIEMQRRLGTENDFFLHTQGTAMPTLFPQVGQSEQSVQLLNSAEILDSKFLGVPSVAGNEIILIAVFWSANPN